MASGNTSEEKKVVVITGASSGIGRATALEFAQKGYHVVLVSRRRQELEKVADECRAFGVRALVVPTDTTDEQAVYRISEAATTAFGGFDIWINNAAVDMYGTWEDAPMDGFRKVIDTNLMGYVYGSQAALTQFKAKGKGRLLTISSVNAEAPAPYASAYVASKYAVRGCI